MTTLIFYLTSTLFFIWIIRNALFWINLWQVKEYRFDRLKIHLRETNQGKDLILSKLNILKNIILIIYLIVIWSYNFSIVYSLIVSLIYFISFINILMEIRSKKLRLPDFTPKVIIILLLALSFELLIFLFPLFDKSFWLLFLDRLLPLFIAAFIAMFWFPSEFYQDILIYKAIKKKEKFKNLTTIGITGSYGKGSTKEFLNTILSYKFNVLKTFGNYNTPIGIAKTILKGLNNKKQIFIAEMGAYKIGEITEMCAIVKPQIGIITAINDQHSSLFNSIKNTMKAKYELVEFLPKNGLALFNGNNYYTKDLYRKTHKHKVLYIANYENDKTDADIEAFNIKVSKFYIIFDVLLKSKYKKPFNLKVNLLGRHNIENLLPAIYIASYLGMSRDEIINSARKITSFTKTMEPFSNVKGVVLIDDTFNSNPQAVLAASDYAKNYRGKKIMVLQPMIELGKNAAGDHYDVALKIGKTFDHLFLTNKNFYDQVKKGIDSAEGKCILAIDSPKNIAEFIDSKLGKGDVVIFEGKESNPVLNLLSYEKIN